jgi:carboxylesterase type B
VQQFSKQTSPVYFYRFSYDGALNVPKRMLLLQFPGAIHADELPYMFEQDIPFPVLPTNFAFTVGRRLVRLWSNFAKYG